MAMKIAQFGGGDGDYTIDVATSMVEALIADEENQTDGTNDKHRMARLVRACEALDALYEVCDWSPKLTKRYRDGLKEKVAMQP